MIYINEKVFEISCGLLFSSIIYNTVHHLHAFYELFWRGVYLCSPRNSLFIFLLALVYNRSFRSNTYRQPDSVRTPFGFVLHLVAKSELGSLYCCHRISCRSLVPLLELCPGQWNCGNLKRRSANSSFPSLLAESSRFFASSALVIRFFPTSNSDPLLEAA